MPTGKLVKSFGGGMINYPHGLHVDKDNNIWVSDGRDMNNGKGHTVMKFNQDGKLLMTLGKPGDAGSEPDHFNEPSDILVAPNGDIFVADGHGGPKTNNRIVKFDKDGKFIKEWGKKGRGPASSTSRTVSRWIPPAACSSPTAATTASRSSIRTASYSPSGSQFGRPSGLFIDKNDMLYVADNSPDEVNPPYRSGIRVGSAQDGIVRAFILELVEVNGVEAVAVDDAGDVFGGYTNTLNLRRWAPKNAPKS